MDISSTELTLRPITPELNYSYDQIIPPLWFATPEMDEEVVVLDTVDSHVEILEHAHSERISTLKK